MTQKSSTLRRHEPTSYKHGVYRGTSVSATVNHISVFEPVTALYLYEQAKYTLHACHLTYIHVTRTQQHRAKIRVIKVRVFSPYPRPQICSIRAGGLASNSHGPPIPQRHTSAWMVGTAVVAIIRQHLHLCTYIPGSEENRSSCTQSLSCVIMSEKGSMNTDDCS